LPFYFSIQLACVCVFEFYLADAFFGQVYPANTQGFERCGGVYIAFFVYIGLKGDAAQI